MSWTNFFPYLIVMAGVTYLIRMLPFVICRKKITSRFARSFLSSAGGFHLMPGLKPVAPAVFG